MASGLQFFALADIFQIARRAPAHFLIRIKSIERFQFVIGVASWRLLANFVVFGAAFARFVTVGAEAPAIRFGDEIALLVEKINVVDLLDRTACKSGLMLDKLFEVRAA